MLFMKKKAPSKYFWLSLVFAAVAGVALHSLYNGYIATAGAQRQELDRLFREMAILKIPHVTRPIEIQLKDVFGNTVRLSDYRGKVVFLNFWATWCPTCVVEMPAMEKLHRRLKEKAFVMVAVNLQESPARVKSFFEKLGLSFISLLDSSGAVGSGFAVRGLPTTFVLDKEGRIIGKALGPREWDSRASIALFEYLIDHQGAPAG